MADKTSEQSRKDRLARQLRENLKRRKAQARNLARSHSGKSRTEAKS